MAWMKCPVCKSKSLAPVALDGRLLSAHRCAACGGQFVRGEQFYRWLDHPDRRTPAAARERDADTGPDARTGSGPVATAGAAGLNGSLDLPPVDSPHAKICPECGKLMSRYRVGHGVDFALDRCAACGGIWFDANEWEALARVGLADRVHFVFSSAWQAEIGRQESAAGERRRLTERIGAGDLAEIDRIVGWLGHHPRRRELVAYLIGHLAPEPRGRSTTEVPTTGFRRRRADHPWAVRHLSRAD